MSDPIKIALIGSAPSSIHQAPYADPSWQIWGCSPGAYGAVPKGRSNIWFEMHRYEPGQTWFSPEYCQFLRDHPCVVVGKLRPEIPNGIELDWQRMLATYSDLFFTSSLAWMLAHAIDVIVAAGTPVGSKIGMWGVDMAATEEYEAQRAGCHYFSIIARQRGIEVGVPPTSDLFRPRFLYGLDEHTHAFVKIRAREQELQQRLAGAEQGLQQRVQEVSFLKGALDDLGYFKLTWPNKDERVEPPVTALPVGMFAPVPASPLVAAVAASEPKKHARRTKPNGADTTPPNIAETRLGPGRFV